MINRWMRACAFLAAVVSVLALGACRGDGGRPAREPVSSVTWTVRGPIGAHVTIETTNGMRRVYPIPASGSVTGSFQVGAHQHANLWADGKRGQALTCALVGADGSTQQDAGSNHCHAQLK